MWYAGIHLDLVLQVRLGHGILAERADLVRKEGIVLDAYKAQWHAQVVKVFRRHRCGVGQGACLDKRPPRRQRRLFITTLLLDLLGEQQDEARTNTVADSVDAVPLLHGVGVSVLGGVNDLVQDGHDTVGRDACEPHVNDKRLGHLGGLELDLLEPRGRVLGNGDCRRGVIASENVGHQHQKALGGKAVGLDLVVDRLDARTAGEEQKQARRRMRVVGRLRDVDLGLVLAGATWGSRMSVVHRFH